MKKYLFYISQNYSFAILRPIQKILWARGARVQWFFEGSAVKQSYLTGDEKQLDSVAQIMAYGPDVVIAPANNIPSFLPGLKVAVFHGFDAGKVDRRGQNDHFKIRGCFDLYCTQGPSTTKPFQDLQKEYGFFNVIETGWPALDPLFGGERVVKKSAKPMILLCSTFSKRLSCARQLLPIIKELSASGRWQWLVQFHPKMAQDVIEQYKAIQGEHLTYCETATVIPLLQQADLMVCDTSSVIPMFALQKKPVITFRNIAPAPYFIDIVEPTFLEGRIEEALGHPASLMAAITKFIEETHPANDGNSAQRVIRAIDGVLAGQYPLSKKKPLNLLRSLKFRKRLNYWQF